MTVQRCPEVSQGQQCILEAGHTSQHRAAWTSTDAVPVMSTGPAAVVPARRAELDERLLAEARGRASNAGLKRVLYLLAAALLLGAIGAQSGDPTLGLAGAAVCVAVAVAVVIRGDPHR